MRKGKNVSKQKISSVPSVEICQDRPENSWEKTNSIDEFLQLVNKTKKKYKELMEKDFDQEREKEIGKNDWKNTTLIDRDKEQYNNRNIINQRDLIKPSYDKVRNWFNFLQIK